MGKNAGIAIVLSIGIFIAYYMFFTPKPVKKQTTTTTTVSKQTAQQQSIQQNQSQIITQQQSSATQTLSQSGTNQAVSGTNQAVSGTQSQQQSNVVKAPTVDSVNSIVPLPEFDYNTINKGLKNQEFIIDKSIETEKYKVSFSQVDGAVKSLKLKDYYNEDGEQIDAVLYPESRIKPLGLSFVDGSRLHLRKPALFQLDPQKSDDKKITLFAKYQFVSNPEQIIKVEKIYTFTEDRYYFSLDIIITNLSDNSIIIKDNHKNKLSGQSASFYIYWGEGIGPVLDVRKRSAYDKNVTSYTTTANDNIEIEPDDKNKYNIKDFKWVGIDSRYLLGAMIKDPKLDNYSFCEVHTTEETKNKFQDVVTIGFQNIILEPNQNFKSKVHIFTGPKKTSVLSDSSYFAGEYDPNLERINERSFFILIDLLAKGIEYLLFAINSIVGNFGLSIIVMTIIFKILLNPLTKKTLESSRKMQALQPKITAINEQFKNKPEAKQKALIELYKKEKINPLGGCLPILVQLPFFWALYNVLPYILDLKNSNFLWINDLSSPDTVLHFHFWPNTLNILPLIMTVMSFLQMKMTPQPPSGTDSQKSQSRMMMFMPLLFLFIFWSMPSGLVLYWTVQNMLQVGQQLFLNYRDARKKDAEGGVKDVNARIRRKNGKGSN